MTSLFQDHTTSCTNFSPRSGSQEFTFLNPKGSALNIIPHRTMDLLSLKLLLFSTKLPIDSCDLIPPSLVDVTATITGSSAHLSDYTQLRKLIWGMKFKINLGLALSLTYPFYSLVRLPLCLVTSRNGDLSIQSQRKKYVYWRSKIRYFHTFWISTFITEYTCSSCFSQNPTLCNPMVL